MIQRNFVWNFAKIPDCVFIKRRTFFINYHLQLVLHSDAVSEEPIGTHFLDIESISNKVDSNLGKNFVTTSVLLFTLVIHLQKILYLNLLTVFSWLVNQRQRMLLWLNLPLLFKGNFCIKSPFILSLLGKHRCVQNRQF